MFAVILLPDFSLQAVLRAEPERFAQPVGLADAEPVRPALIQLTPAARAQGVNEGMSPSQAMARCAGLIIRSRSLVQEQIVSEILLQTAYAFSPHLEMTQPGICTMELKGLNLPATRGALQEWAAKMIHALDQFHLQAQIGIALAPELALLAARRGRPFQFVEDVETFVSQLPVAALEPPPSMLEILDRWGIQTAGAFLALGKERVVERLGAEALELFEKVSPTAVRPLQLAVPAEEFLESMEFEHEVETVEPLWFVLRRLVEQLSCRLAVLCRVVSGFQLQLGLASGAVCERALKIPDPTGNVEVLFRILQTQLENVRTDSPITSVRLSAEPSRPETHQFGLFETTLRDPNQFAETLGRLTALCGSDRVGTPELEATHRPDAFRLKPPEFGGEVRSNFSPAHVSAPGLPLRRFRPALSAQIEFRDRRPVAFRSSVFNGPIAGIRGPFLSSGNWWEESRWAREEWDVETFDGGLYRIFRCAAGDFVEGAYD